jgi:hypothetical protein
MAICCFGFDKGYDVPLRRTIVQLHVCHWIIMDKLCDSPVGGQGMADFPPTVSIEPVLQPPETLRTGEHRSVAFDVTYATRLD